MALNKASQSIDTFEKLSKKQGGSFFLKDDRTYYASNQYVSTARSLRTTYGNLFKFSLYNYDTDIEEIELGLLINPTDIQVGQSFLSSNSYTRQAWVSSLWGTQQVTIACSGKAAAFFVGTNVKYQDKVFPSGLSTANRRESLGFINLLSLISLYKNNGSYFLEGNKNYSLFGGTTSRVVNVMDSILLSYDGSEFVGSFNAFTLDEDPTKPFSLSFNFEYVVSCMRGDSMEGHLRMRGNDLWSEEEDKIPISIQGFNTTYSKTVSMSVEDLNKVFKISGSDSTETGSNFFDPISDEEFNKIQELKDGKWDSATEVITSDTNTGAIKKTGDTYEVKANDGSKTTMYTITGDGKKVKELSGQEILEITTESGAGAFGIGGVKNVIQLYSQECSLGVTYADLLKSCEAVGGFKLDYVTLTNTFNIEAGYHIKKLPNGEITVDPKVQGDFEVYKTGPKKDQKVLDANGKEIPTSLGIGQINKDTYSGLSKDSKFTAYMEKLNFPNLSWESCYDPAYSMAVSAYLYNEKASYTGVDHDPVKTTIAYNSGFKYLNSDTLPFESVKYVNAYAKILNDEVLVGKINKAFD